MAKKRSKVEADRLVSEPKKVRKDCVASFVDDFSAYIRTLEMSKNTVYNMFPKASEKIEFSVDPKLLAVTVGGSYPLHTMLSDGFVDLYISVPGLYQEKDEWNYRYLHKKQIMCQWLAIQLAKCLLNLTDIHIIDELKGSLGFTVNSGKVFKVCVHFFTEDSAKLYRLAPKRNNLSDFFGKKFTEETSLYNSIVLGDFTRIKIHEYLGSALTSEDQKECLKMLKAWTRKMGFSQNYSSVDSFLITVLFGQWAKSAVNITDTMQMLKAFLGYISSKAFSEPIFLGGQFDDSTIPRDYKDAFSPLAFKESFAVNVIDPSGQLNIFSHVTLQGIEAFKHFSGALLATLNSKIQAFSLEDLLISKKDDLEFFDFAFQVDCTDFNGSNSDYALCPDKKHSAFRKASGLLAKALSQRISIISGRECDDGFILRLKVNLDKCFGLVDLGPLADGAKDAISEFKALWGAKAELRRFESGVVQWAAAWPELAGKRHCIVKVAIQHLLRHHKISTASTVGCEQLDFCLEPEILKRSLKPFSLYHAAFSSLCKTLTGLSQLPLSISQIIPLSDTLRYTAVFPLQTEAKVGGRHAPITEGLLVFQRSSKWPNDLQALKCAKQGFLLQIQKLLEQDHQLPCSIDCRDDFIDVFVHSIVVRLRIYVEKERRLLKLDQNELFLQQYNYLNQDRPLLHSKIHSLATSHITFGPVCRLLKRWTASQLYSFVQEEFWEILVGIVYSQSQPGSSFCGFYRCLKFIAEHRHDAPLIFDPDCSLSLDTLEDIQKDASLSLYCSFLETGKFVFTRFMTAAEWQQLQRIAMACLVILDEHDYSILSELFNPVLIYSPTLRKYEFKQTLLNAPLKEDKQADERVDKLIRKAAGPMSAFVKSLPGFNILEECALRIQSDYKTRCFYDKYSGDCILVPSTVGEIQIN